MDPRSDPARLPQIDVLRGFAALGVFFFHLFMDIGGPKRWLPPLTIAGHTFAKIPNFISLGAYGVSLFFVVSGFCLSLPQWRRRRAGGSPSLHVRTYARNRFARIVPAYWAAVLLAAVIRLAISPWTVPQTAWHALVHATFLHGFARTTVLSLNAALWSMATEVQFYVAFPLLLALAARVGKGRFVALAALVNVAYRLALPHLASADVAGGSVSMQILLSLLLPGRILEFALGIALAELYVDDRPRVRRVALPALLLGVPAALGVRLAGPAELVEPLFGVAWFGVVGVMIARPWEDSAVRRRLASFGRASYAFFLVHAPLAQLVSYLVPALSPARAASSPYSAYLLMIALSFPVSLAASVALYLRVELPLWGRLRSDAGRARAAAG